MNATMKYLHRELPFVEDATVQAAGAALGALRAAVSRGLSAIVAGTRNRMVGPPFRMCYGVVLRMLDCSLSLEVLIAKGRHRDAATLLLTLIELRLDLQYAARDASRVVEWLANADRGRKPWRVAAQIKAVFSDPGERDAELENYRHFSMIKHGNPASGAAGFPVSLEADALTVFDEQVGRDLSVTYLFSAGTNIRDGFSSATQLRDVSEMALEGIIDEIDKSMQRLNAVHTGHVYQMVHLLHKRSSDRTDA